MKATEVRIGMKVRTIENSGSCMDQEEGVLGVVSDGPALLSFGEGWYILHTTRRGELMHVPYWFSEFVEVGSAEEAAYFTRVQERKDILRKLTSHEKKLLGLET